MGKKVFYNRVLVPLILMILLATTYNAYADYSYISATVYADNWALSRNSNYPNFAADCMNFVSQCLHEGGGLPFDDIHDWYVYKTLTGFRWGRAWSIASELR